MMWIARTGSQWRHLPDEYGKWNSVFRRYRRWVSTGVFDAMLETLTEMVERDVTADMIDSTVVRAHHCAVGIKGDSGKPRLLVDREVASAQSSTPDATQKGALWQAFAEAEDDHDRQQSQGTVPARQGQPGVRAARPNALVGGRFYLRPLGWLCLCGLRDRHARRIVGWKVSTSATAGFVLDALEQAIHARRPGPDDGLVHHSDRGVQYLAMAYTQRLEDPTTAARHGEPASKARIRRRPSHEAPSRHLRHRHRPACCRDQSGAGEWRMPWHHSGAPVMRPTSVAGRRNPINRLVLWATADACGYASGIWATYQQWRAHGGQVRKGEIGTHVILWKKVERGEAAVEAAAKATAAPASSRAASSSSTAIRWTAPRRPREGGRAHQHLGRRCADLPRRARRPGRIRPARRLLSPRHRQGLHARAHGFRP
jgi:transposase